MTGRMADMGKRSWMAGPRAALRGLLGAPAVTPPPEPPPPTGNDTLDEYVVSFPSSQNAVDSLPGWNQNFPPHVAVTAGSMQLFDDPRILWALEQTGSLAGRRVLEIGPLEASHTYMLDQQQPALLDAVEANRLCFLRCLVVKEILRLQHARFHLGDCQLWLEQNPQVYDVIVASGVLYHMQDPVRFLSALAARTDQCFLWTHYADDAAMPPDDSRRGAFTGQVETVEAFGGTVKLYPRSYLGSWKNKAFCGGMHDLHRWMDRQDLLALLGRLGFSDIRIWGDEPDHPYGPAFSLYARRPAAPA
jgi:hypothetical protein